MDKHFKFLYKFSKTCCVLEHVWLREKADTYGCSHSSDAIVLLIFLLIISNLLYSNAGSRICWRRSWYSLGAVSWGFGGCPQSGCLKLPTIHDSRGIPILAKSRLDGWQWMNMRPWWGSHSVLPGDVSGSLAKTSARIIVATVSLTPSVPGSSTII